MGCILFEAMLSICDGLAVFMESGIILPDEELVVFILLSEAMGGLALMVRVNAQARTANANLLRFIIFFISIIGFYFVFVLVD
jgi:hypothetical protein